MEYARRIRWGNVGLLGIVAVLVAAALGLFARSRPSVPESRPAPPAIERPQANLPSPLRPPARRRRAHHPRPRRHKAPRAPVGRSPAPPVPAPLPAQPAA